MKRLSRGRTGLRVMVAEETVERLYTLRFILESLGYRVEEVGPSHDLRQRCAAFAPAVVFIDMMLPGGRGMEILGQLRACGDSTPRLIAVTADVVPFTEAELRSGGAHEVLAKPYTVSQIQEIVERT